MKNLVVVLVSTSLIGLSSNAVADPSQQTRQDKPGYSGDSLDKSGSPGDTRGNEAPGKLKTSQDVCQHFVTNPWAPYNLIPCWANSLREDENH